MIYEITKSIHSEIERLKQKLGLEIEIESDKKISARDILFYRFETDISKFEQENSVWFIQPPQIRQILVGLQEVLGENPEWREANNSFIESSVNILHYFPQSQAQALCNKWIDGLNPLFDREPETVLIELLKILKIL